MNVKYKLEGHELLYVPAESREEMYVGVDTTHDTCTFT